MFICKHITQQPIGYFILARLLLRFLGPEGLRPTQGGLRSSVMKYRVTKKVGFYIKQFLFPNRAVKLCFRAAMFLLRITFRWDYKSLCSRWKEELGGKIRPTRSIWRSLESQQKWTKLWGECIKWALTKPLYFNEMWFILKSNHKGPNWFLIVIIIYHQIPTKHWMPCYLFWQFILLKKDTKSAQTDASLHSVKNLVLSR